MLIRYSRIANMSKKTADEHIRLETDSLHVRVRAFAMFSDEAVDPRRDNGQRYRAELEHGIVESADVEFRSERFLRLFAGTQHRERCSSLFVYAVVELVEHACGALFLFRRSDCSCRSVLPFCL